MSSFFTLHLRRKEVDKLQTVVSRGSVQLYKVHLGLLICKKNEGAVLEDKGVINNLSITITLLLLYLNKVMLQMYARSCDNIDLPYLVLHGFLCKLSTNTLDLLHYLWLLFAPLLIMLLKRISITLKLPTNTTYF